MTILKFTSRGEPVSVYDKKITKKCSCGLEVVLDKTEAKHNEVGYWQECECGSTLLFLHEKTKQKRDKQVTKDKHNQRIKQEYKLNKTKQTTTRNGGNK